MARDLIDVQYATTDSTQSVGAVKITKSTVTAANGIGIKKAFANKNNTLMICVENNDDAAATVTFKAGNAYPNAMLGDLTVSLLAGTLNVFQIQDPSRFENKDGSLNVDFSVGFDGKIFAVAKSTALNV